MINSIVHGDCLEKLKEIESDSIDCIVTDPPYGYSFMNKDWDKAVVSVDIWKECLRVLKSGAFAFIMSSPRQDVLCKMILNLIDAGFETNFTSIYWTYASGFPKAVNVSKLVDKRLGAEREIIGYDEQAVKKTPNGQDETLRLHGLTSLDELKEYAAKGLKLPDGRDAKLTLERTLNPSSRIGEITAPKSEQAKKLDGSYAGFQPKPALETILVVMKPLSQRNYVEQALDNSKGITWLDDCRIPFQNENDQKKSYREGIHGTLADRGTYGKYNDSTEFLPYKYTNEKGRFPANLLVSDDSLNDGKIRKFDYHIPKVAHTTGNIFPKYNNKQYEEQRLKDEGSYSRYFDIDKWYNEAQFIITPKASASERNKGLENEEPKQVRPEDGSWKSLDIFSNRYTEKNSNPNNRGKTPLHQNNHPTVKPLKLMSYLITMGSRPNDIILDPFCGSGTTCIAAYQLNRKFIGIEKESEYVEIARKRLEPYLTQQKLII